eukprot:567415-Amorphochlora_amoeboformis.AAC.1
MAAPAQAAVVSIFLLLAAGSTDCNAEHGGAKLKENSRALGRGGAVAQNGVGTANPWTFGSGVLSALMSMRGGKKGTPSQGKHHNHKNHVLCRRCGKRSLHASKKKCASCGFPDRKMRRYNWGEKAKRRRTEGSGRMRYLKKFRESVRKAEFAPPQRTTPQIVHDFNSVMNFARTIPEAKPYLEEVTITPTHLFLTLGVAISFRSLTVVPS